MEEKVLKKAKGILKNKESIFEPTNIGFVSGPGSSSGLSLQHRCKKIAKKFMKSISHPPTHKEKFNSNKCSILNCDTLKMPRGTNRTKNRLVISKDETFRDYESWEDMKKSIDHQISMNFDIRNKYDGIRPVDVNPPRQNYYIVPGYGLVCEKFQPDFKKLEADKFDLIKTKSMSDLKMNGNSKGYSRIQTDNLKKELNDMHINRIQKSIPTRTRKRSKSVTFIDVCQHAKTVEKDVKFCPAFKNCCKMSDPKINYLNLNNHFIEDRRPLSSGYVNLGTFRRNIPGGKNKYEPNSKNYYSYENNLNSIINDDMSCFQSALTKSKSTNDIKTIVEPSTDRINRSEVKRWVSLDKIENKTINKLDEPVSLVYRNPFYSSVDSINNNNADNKNYHVKMFEPKLSMELVVGNENASNQSCNLPPNQCFRVNMNRVESITCDNHFYEQLK